MTNPVPKTYSVEFIGRAIRHHIMNSGAENAYPQVFFSKPPDVTLLEL